MLDKVKWGHHNRTEITRLRAMSDEDLFDEMVSASEPDDYDGAFTGWGQFLQEVSEIVYRERKGYSYHPSNYALFNSLFGPDELYNE